MVGRHGTMSTVDVVVPCFNYGHYLSSCVRSVLEQTDVDVRVLVIDDCSTDGSGEIAEAVAASDSRVELIRHDTNRGHIATYNEGLLGWAEREYVVLLSADDLLAPGCLGRAVALMDADRRIGMVYGHAPTFERDDTLRTPRQGRVRHATWAGSTWIEQRCRAGVNVISSPEVVSRTSIQHAVGGYEPSLPHVGDLEMWLRLAASADVGYVAGAPQAYYRVHPASMQRTTFAAHLDDLRQRREGFDFFFSHAGATLTDADRLHDLARRALAREALWRACRAYERDALASIPVQDLVEFATSTYQDVETTPEFRALRRRRRLGPTVCHRTQLFVVGGVRHRVASTYRRQRWKRRGT